MPRAGLDAEEKNIFVTPPGRELNPARPTTSLVAILTELLRVKVPEIQLIQ